MSVFAASSKLLKNDSRYDHDLNVLDNLSPKNFHNQVDYCNYKINGRNYKDNYKNDNCFFIEKNKNVYFYSKNGNKENSETMNKKIFIDNFDIGECYNNNNFNNYYNNNSKKKYNKEENKAKSNSVSKKVFLNYSLKKPNSNNNNNNKINNYLKSKTASLNSNSLNKGFKSFKTASKMNSKNMESEINIYESKEFKGFIASSFSNLKISNFNSFGSSLFKNSKKNKIKSEINLNKESLGEKENKIFFDLKSEKVNKENNTSKNKIFGIKAFNSFELTKSNNKNIKNINNNENEFKNNVKLKNKKNYSSIKNKINGKINELVKTKEINDDKLNKQENGFFILKKDYLTESLKAKASNCKKSIIEKYLVEREDEKTKDLLFPLTTIIKPFTPNYLNNNNNQNNLNEESKIRNCFSAFRLGKNSISNSSNNAGKDHFLLENTKELKTNLNKDNKNEKQDIIENFHQNKNYENDLHNENTVINSLKKVCFHTYDDNNEAKNSNEISNNNNSKTKDFSIRGLSAFAKQKQNNIFLDCIKQNNNYNYNDKINFANKFQTSPVAMSHFKISKPENLNDIIKAKKPVLTIRPFSQIGHFSNKLFNNELIKDNFKNEKTVKIYYEAETKLNKHIDDFKNNDNENLIALNGEENKRLNYGGVFTFDNTKEDSNYNTINNSLNDVQNFNSNEINAAIKKENNFLSDYSNTYADKKNNEDDIYNFALEKIQDLNIKIDKGLQTNLEALEYKEESESKNNFIKKRSQNKQNKNKNKVLNDINDYLISKNKNFLSLKNHRELNDINGIYNYTKNLKRVKSSSNGFSSVRNKIGFLDSKKQIFNFNNQNIRDVFTPKESSRVRYVY